MARVELTVVELDRFARSRLFPLRHFPSASHLPPPVPAVGLSDRTRTIHVFSPSSLPVFTAIYYCLSSLPPSHRPRRIPEFRAFVTPPSPSLGAKSFFKPRLAVRRSERYRQGGKKLSKREPLGLFPTSSAMQTRHKRAARHGSALFRRAPHRRFSDAFPGNMALRRISEGGSLASESTS